jgi:hypothetical protein
MKKKVLVGIVIVLVLIQFIQPAHNDGAAATAQDITHTVAVPDTIAAILKTSCYDCHSNHTNYPWYNNITPVNWWLRNHVEEGKRELNFSTFNTYTFKKKAKRLEQTATMTKKDEMPLPSYLWIHGEAKLTDAQKEMLAVWARTAREQVLQDSLQQK